MRLISETYQENEFIIAFGESSFGFIINVKKLTLSCRVGNEYDYQIIFISEFDNLDGLNSYLLKIKDKFKAFFLSKSRNMHLNLGHDECIYFEHYVQFIRKNSGQVYGELTSKTIGSGIGPSWNSKVLFQIDTSYFYKFEESIENFVKNLKEYEGQYFEEELV